MPPLNLNLNSEVKSGVNSNGANWSIGNSGWSVNMAGANSASAITTLPPVTLFALLIGAYFIWAKK